MSQLTPNQSFKKIKSSYPITDVHKTLQTNIQSIKQLDFNNLFNQKLEKFVESSYKPSQTRHVQQKEAIRRAPSENMNYFFSKQNFEKNQNFRKKFSSIIFKKSQNKIQSIDLSMSKPETCKIKYKQQRSILYQSQEQIQESSQIQTQKNQKENSVFDKLLIQFQIQLKSKKAQENSADFLLELLDCAKKTNQSKINQKMFDILPHIMDLIIQLKNSCTLKDQQIHHMQQKQERYEKQNLQLLKDLEQLKLLKGSKFSKLEFNSQKKQSNIPEIIKSYQEDKTQKIISIEKNQLFQLQEHDFEAEQSSKKIKLDISEMLESSFDFQGKSQIFSMNENNSNMKQSKGEQKYMFTKKKPKFVLNFSLLEDL